MSNLRNYRLPDTDPVVDERRHFDKAHLRLDAVELDDVFLQLRGEECAGGFL